MRSPVPSKSWKKLNAGEGRINFRLRDAAFGRQRYWGEPIPIYYKDGMPISHCRKVSCPWCCPRWTSSCPPKMANHRLARAKNWNYEGPSVGDHHHARLGRQQLVLPALHGPDNEGRFASPEAINYWQQMDLYMGGSEHATGHLLYFRFWTKFLHDRGWLPF
jgi:leucyl-tRNA synthetase